MTYREGAMYKPGQFFEKVNFMYLCVNSNVQTTVML